MRNAGRKREANTLSNPTIVAVFVAVYLAAVFVGTLAFLRMRRENEDLRDRLNAFEREAHRAAEADHSDVVSGTGA